MTARPPTEARTTRTHARPPGDRRGCSPPRARPALAGDRLAPRPWHSTEENSMTLEIENDPFPAFESLALALAKRAVRP